MAENMEANESEVKEYSELDKYAFVSLCAFEDDHIGYCYRENTDIKIDSGWRFLFGDEDEEYLDNPDNSLTKDLSEILEWKPELREILSSKPGTEFEWNPDTEKFDKI